MVGVENGKVVGLQNFSINLVTAILLALFFAFAVRSFLVFFLRRDDDPLLIRVMAGLIFLALGCSYALFSANLIVWDRPTRGLGTIAGFLILIPGAWRSKRENTSSHSSFRTGVLNFLGILGLLVVAAAALLRAGYIPLTGDRVTLMVEVTGETRAQTSHDGSLVAHRAIVWLPSGVPAGDFWVSGNRMAVSGRVIRLPASLNTIRVPNLYKLVSVHNGAEGVNRGETCPGDSLPFPDSGPLNVHPWWRPIQTRLLEILGSNALGLFHSSANESPYYPLVGSDGKPTRGRFLLVLPPNGMATSRGSSPLDSKTNSTP